MSLFTQMPPSFCFSFFLPFCFSRLHLHGLFPIKPDFDCLAVQTASRRLPLGAYTMQEGHLPHEGQKKARLANRRSKDTRYPQFIFNLLLFNFL